MGAYTGDYGSTMSKPRPGSGKGIARQERARRHVEALGRNRTYFDIFKDACRPERDGGGPYSPSKHHMVVYLGMKLEAPKPATVVETKPAQNSTPAKKRYKHKKH